MRSSPRNKSQTYGRDARIAPASTAPGGTFDSNDLRNDYETDKKKTIGSTWDRMQVFLTF